jgi:hypothetical protein
MEWIALANLTSPAIFAQAKIRIGKVIEPVVVKFYYT